MKRVVISQPMFFPWVGMLEQISLADAFVYYDDVQFSKGSFTNRVQIKTSQGFKWMTVPVKVNFGSLISEVQLNNQQDWKTSHLAFLKQTYSRTPFLDDMLRVVKEVYEQPFNNISDLAIASMEALCNYFLIAERTRFIKSSDMMIDGSSSRRVLDIVKNLNGDAYITGHGARNYLDHQLFEDSNIKVEYIFYEKKPYKQQDGEFNPFVSALDLIANAGQEGKEVICSKTLYWKDFIKQTDTI
jgi:hypothetical protein